MWVVSVVVTLVNAVIISRAVIIIPSGRAVITIIYSGTIFERVFGLTSSIQFRKVTIIVYTIFVGIIVVILIVVVYVNVSLHITMEVN
jgi:preprotein translocase subunit SecG